jgi:hypothetical protein
MSAAATSLTPDQAKAQKAFLTTMESSLGSLRQHWLAVIRDQLLLTQDSGTWPAMLLPPPASEEGAEAAGSRRLRGLLFASGDDTKAVKAHFEDCWPVVAKAAAILTNTEDGLREPRAASDCQVLLGISVCYLAQATVKQDSELVVQSLQATQQLLLPPFLTLDELPAAACAEMLRVISAVIQAYTCDPVQRAVADLLNQLLCGDGKIYFRALLEQEESKASNGIIDALTKALLEVCVWPVHRQLAKGMLVNKSSKQAGDAAGLRGLLVPLRTLPSFLLGGQAQTYFPALLELALRLAKHSACDCAETLDLSLANLQSVLSALEAAEVDPKQKAVMFSSGVATSLDYIKDVLEDVDAVGQDTISLFDLWVSINSNVPHDVVQSGTPLFRRAVTLWQQGLLSSRADLRAQVIAALRKFLQSGLADQKQATTSRSFLGILGPQVLLAMKLEQKVPSQQREHTCTEGTKILLLAFSLANPEHQTALVAVLLPVLLDLLAAGASLRQLACQSLLLIAQRASAAFKQNLVALPPDQRQLLETSLRAALSAGSNSAQAQTTTGPAKPMKLDMSRYNK